MTAKTSDQRDRLIARINDFLSARGDFDTRFNNPGALITLLTDLRAYLLSQTYWPQGVGKPKQDYSGDWKRRFRDG